MMTRPKENDGEIPRIFFVISRKGQSVYRSPHKNVILFRERKQKQ